MAVNLDLIISTIDHSSAKLKAIDKQVGGLRKTLGDVGKIASGFVVGNAVTAVAGQVSSFVSGSIGAAKDLGESLNAVNVVFGKSSQKILDWGKNNATSFGLSSRQFNQLVTPMGAMLQNFGFSAGDAAQKSIDLTKRASDMASVFNVDVSSALEAIQAGLRGEADPLEKFGVGLNAAAISAKALEMTGKSVAGVLTDQEKKAASLALIFEQTDKVAGDFASTSGELANAQRIAAAKTEELQAKLGVKLLPVTLKITQAKLKLTGLLVDKVIPAFGKLGRAVTDAFKWMAEHKQKVIAVLAGVAAAIVTGMVPAVVAWTAAEVAKTAALLASAAAFAIANAPMIALIATVGAVVAGLVLLEQKTGLVSAAFGVVKAAAMDAAEFLGPVLRAALDDLKQAWADLQPVIEVATVVFRETLSSIKTLIETYVKIYITYIKFLFDSIRNAFAFFKALFTGDWDGMWKAVKAQFSNIVNTLSSVFGIALDAIKTLIGTKLTMLKGIGSDIGNAIAGAFESVMKASFNWVIDQINAVLRAYNSIPLAPDIGQIGKIGQRSNAGGGSTIGGFARGGVVPGFLGQPQLAVVHGGEQVLTPSQRGMGGAMTLVFQPGAVVFNGINFDDPIQFRQTVDRFWSAVQDKARGVR